MRDIGYPNARRNIPNPATQNTASGQCRNTAWGENPGNISRISRPPASDHPLHGGIRRDPATLCCPPSSDPRNLALFLAAHWSDNASLVRWREQRRASPGRPCYFYHRPSGKHRRSAPMPCGVKVQALRPVRLDPGMSNSSPPLSFHAAWCLAQTTGQRFTV